MLYRPPGGAATSQPSVATPAAIPDTVDADTVDAEKVDAVHGRPEEPGERSLVAWLPARPAPQHSAHPAPPWNGSPNVRPGPARSPGK